MAHIMATAGLAEAALMMGIALLALWGIAMALAAIGIFFRILRPRSSGWIAISMGVIAAGITLVSALIIPSLLSAVPLAAAAASIVMGLKALDGPIRLSNDQRVMSGDAVAALLIAVFIGIIIVCVAWHQVNTL